MSFGAALLQIFMGMLGSIGFGILFNLRGRRLLLAGLGGFISWALYLIFYHFTGNEILCYGISTVIISIYSQILARIMKSPATLFLVPSVVPMMPGGYLYYSMLYAVSGDWDMFLTESVLTLSTATSIAVGMMVGSSVYKTIMAILRAVMPARFGPRI